MVYLFRQIYSPLPMRSISFSKNCNNNSYIQNVVVNKRNSISMKFVQLEAIDYNGKSVGRMLFCFSIIIIIIIIGSFHA